MVREGVPSDHGRVRELEKGGGGELGVEGHGHKITREVLHFKPSRDLGVQKRIR